VKGEAPIRTISVGVFSGGREVYAGFAVDGAEEPGPGTKFNVASLSKAHTALAAAVLVARGDLDLDKPLDGCRRRRLRAFCGRPRTTLRHLLTHSSGLPSVPSDLPRKGKYDLSNLRRWLSRARSKTPGKEFSYSTAGYSAVAMVLERKAKNKFVELLRELVLEPLGSGAVVDPASTDELAPGYRNGGPAEARPTREAFVASGGLIASSRDLLKLASAFAQPERVPALSAALRLCQTVDSGLSGFRAAAVAFGWQVDRERGYFWHPGVSSVHRTAIAVDTKSGNAVVLLAGEHMRLSDYRLEDAAFAVLDELAETKRGAAE